MVLKQVSKSGTARIQHATKTGKLCRSARSCVRALVSDEEAFYMELSSGVRAFVAAVARASSPPSKIFIHAAPQVIFAAAFYKVTR
jgi:hypothetical protein